MHKFQYKFTILNFLTCANLHMIKKTLKLLALLWLKKANKKEKHNYEET
jgi:hypothetical protein